MISITELRRGLGKFIALTKRIGDLPIPSNFQQDISIYLNNKEQLIATMKKIGGKWEKCPNDFSFQLVQKLSDGLNIKLIVPRSAVCEKKVVGTRVVPASHIEEYTVEEVEWICLPLLDEGQEIII